MSGVDLKLAGDWNKASVILGTSPAALKAAIDRAVLQEAQLMRKKIVQGIREQAPGGQRFKPLSRTTIAMRRARGGGRGSTKALIDRGDLRNSIKVVKKTGVGGSEAFVGVLRSARGRNGQRLVNIAKVHEFGSNTIVIRVTPAMRKFLMATFRDAGLPPQPGKGGFKRGIIVMKIPARPYIRPVIEKFFDGPDAAARFQARVSSGMGGIMGLSPKVRDP